MSNNTDSRFLPVSLGLLAASIILFEIALTRIFAVTLFANYAHIILGLGMFGFSIGALVVYFSNSIYQDSNISASVSRYLSLQGLIYILVTFISLNLQIFSQAAPDTFSYQSRENDLLYGWASVSLYLLFISVLISFSTAGGIVCLIFKHCKKNPGILYGYDLIGAGLGAILFIPLSQFISAPDLTFVCVGLCAIGAFILSYNHTNFYKKLSLLSLIVCTILLAKVSAGSPIFSVKFAAGLPESSVVYQKWTPISRLTIHTDSRSPGREIMVFDSASVSMIVKSEDHRQQILKESTRALVYSLVPNNSRVAILAASAGPEVVAAQGLGLWDITAIDINAEAFKIIANRYKDYKYNPFLNPQLKKINADGRAAIRHSKGQFDVIHMVHANLWSIAGLLANAWSPWMLSTKEAFWEYFEKLSPDGILSFSRGFETETFIPSVVEALRERGVANPFEHIVFIGGNGFILLVRSKPWSDKQILELESAFKANFGREIIWHIHPKRPVTHTTWYNRWFGLMTDDRPYPERSGRFWSIAQKLSRKIFNNDKSALVTDGVTIVYVSIIFQVFFAITIGLFTVLPVYIFSRRINSRHEQLLNGIYFSCLGFGYVSLQILLVQRLVLYIGHPTYALCLVIGSMLVFSGLGSILSERFSVSKFRLPRILFLFLLLIIGIILSSTIGPAAMQAWTSDYNVIFRCAIAVIVTGIGTLLLGIPFPIGLNHLNKTYPDLSPFAWAFNGWFSIIGAVLSIILSRHYGYSSLLYASISCYFIAGLICAYWSTAIRATSMSIE